MSRFEWPIAVLCMLLCAVECHLYCIVPSDNALCTCQDLCLTLSEISINITYYLESNTTLIFQPGNHNLDSNLVISNISVLKLYSDEPSANRIVCTPFTNIHFIEVSKVVISGLEFIACGSSIVRAVHFELLDTILTSENGSSTALMLSEIMAANIVSCSFKGVTVSIVHQSFVTINSVSIFDSSASLAALAVYNSSVEFIGFTRLMNNQRALLAYNAKIWFIGNTTFSNCTITNNDSHVTMPYGDGGGAINSYLSHLIFQGSTTFVLNSAKHGGAIFAVESLVMITRNNDHLTPSSSIFTQAGVVIVNNNIGRTTGGGMYLYYSRLIVRNDLCHLIRNDALEKGGAIHAVHSYIKLESRDMCKDSLLMLEKNSARLGGGIYLEGASRITLSVSNSSVAFVENSADYGAAIYVDDYTKYDTCHATSRIDIAPDTSCFISMCDPYLITPTILSTVKESIVLYNNTAKYSGANLFGGLLDRCVPPSVGNATSKGAVNGLFSDGLTYLQTVSNINDSDTGSITSHPMKVCFCNQSLPNCSLRTHTMEVQKGQPFTLSLATVDQVGAPVSGKIVAYLSSTQGSLGGGHIIELTDACTDLNYTVFSSDESDVLNMYADGPCGNADLSRLTVTLKFTTCTCPVGFQLSTTNNRTSCECICDPLIYPEYISSCSIQPEPLIERKSNIWINPETTHETNETIYKVGSFCPFGRCLGETHINLNTEAGIAAQCISTIYEGELCSTCSATYSISLGGKRCVKCPDIWPLSFIAIILGSLLAGLGLVVSIMAMNFTVAVGTINGFIFYANIIDVFDMFYLPFYQPNFPDILIEWLNLDPGIDVCFFPGHDIYHHMWIRLLFPLYIVSILFGIIFVSRHSVRFSHFIGNKKPIAVLATLMLLSYTHFLQTALLVLIPSTIKTVAQTGSHENSVWFLNGNVDYFEGRHIPLFILAIFILLFAVIYKIIIFSWQWVVRLPKIWILKWTNNQKLNSFIQTYQAPFCDRHRYWTGLLLLERVLLTCISILTANAHPNTLLLSIISVLGFLLLLRLTYAKNLYKKWPVDLLETVLIINLFIFTLAVYISDDVSKKRIFAYVSVTFVLLLLLIVIAYHIYAYILVGAFPKLKRARGKQMTRPKPNSQSNVANNLQEIPGRVFYSRDRYHEMVGSIELANTDYQLPQLNPLPAEPTANLKPQVPSIIISSFLDLSDCDSEVEHQPQQPGLLTVTKDDNFDSPYRIFDSSPSKPTASDNACLNTLHYEELEESGDLN